MSISYILFLFVKKIFKSIQSPYLFTVYFEIDTDAVRDIFN